MHPPILIYKVERNLYNIFLFNVLKIYWDTIFMDKMEKTLASVEKKVEKFTEILEKFGLNLIQTLGKTNHQLGVLTEKIGKLEKDLVVVKGFGPKFQEISKLRMEFMVENKNIQAQLANLGNKLEFELPQKASKESDEKVAKSPLELLERFRKEVKTASTKSELSQAISSVREQLYILTGGHKILLELRTFEHKLQSLDDVTETDFQNNLTKKITEWQKLF